MSNEFEVACKIFTELRQEVLASQKIRAQIIGVKITFVGTAIGLIIHQENGISGSSGLPNTLLVIPAFAAIFFDLLIISYGFSIKRIGFYCRNFLEEEIRAAGNMSKDFIFWQQFLEFPKTRQKFAHFGNFGLTVLAIVTAGIGLRHSTQTWVTVLGVAAMVFGLAVSVWACRTPGVFKRGNFPVEELAKTSKSRMAAAVSSAAPAIVSANSTKPNTTTTVTTTTTTTTAA